MKDRTGYFIDETVTHRGTPWFPHDHYGYDRITFDAAANRWIDLWTESDGGYGVQESAGWNGTRFVWRDVTPQAKGDAPHDHEYTITKIGKDRFTTATSITAARGERIGVVGSCDRVA